MSQVEGLTSATGFRISGFWSCCVAMLLSGFSAVQPRKFRPCLNIGGALRASVGR